MRLTLSADDPPNDDAATETLREFLFCPNCAGSVVLTFAATLAGVLNEHQPGWQPEMAHRLAQVLDAMAEAEQQ